MRTRAVSIPVIGDDEVTVIDDPTVVGIPVHVGRDHTRDLDTTLRHPAECRFFIRAGFEVGAPTDVIADSLALGEQWVIGQAWLARDWNIIISLSDPDVPPERQIVAWRLVPRADVP